MFPSHLNLARGTLAPSVWQSEQVLRATPMAHVGLNLVHRHTQSVHSLTSVLLWVFASKLNGTISSVTEGCRVWKDLQAILSNIVFGTTTKKLEECYELWNNVFRSLKIICWCLFSNCQFWSLCTDVLMYFIIYFIWVLFFNLSYPYPWHWMSSVALLIETIWLKWTTLVDSCYAKYSLQLPLKLFFFS